MNGLLSFLSLFYQAGSRIKNALYGLRVFTAKKALFPVVSIGNVTFGGSGKTPLVMAVIEMLLAHNYKPALVTRGYKGKWEKTGNTLSDGQNLFGDWTDAGDEATMVAQNFPQAGVFVGKDRLASCRKALMMGFDLVILDDGFQHRKLARDFDIVLHDFKEKNPLRESISSLKRAHVLLYKEEENAGIKPKRLNRFPSLETYPYSVVNKGFFSLDGRIQPKIDFLRKKRILAFCGIARPARFLIHLRASGINPCSFLKFSDHHAYPSTTQDKIVNEFQKQKADAFITTEKDAVKVKNLKAFQDRTSYYLRIGLKIEETFQASLLSFLENEKVKQGKVAI